MKLAVLGAGAWGTALAVNAASRSDSGLSVSLWARDSDQRDAMRVVRENRRYLPGVALPADLELGFFPADGPAGAALARFGDADLVVIGTPMSALRGMLIALRDHPGPVAWLCKGFEASLAGQPGLLGHEVCAQVAPALRVGVLSGPSFALEVARGQPTALVAASEHAHVRDALVAAFHGPTLRVYANEDVVGVEVGGAVKNVLAIATGLCDGLGLGLNARAALVTRGLAEMTRLGLALGARAETFMGLSGLGDLVLTATGDLSRN
ncbi:MAG: NAD(P)H-dependent glycerol-3-phosphate dehydrogenase, partial [Hydrogenophaga sp.]